MGQTAKVKTQQIAYFRIARGVLLFRAHRGPVNVNINLKHNPVPQNQKGISPQFTATTEVFHRRAELEGYYYLITPAL